MYNLVAGVVGDHHVEGTDGATALPCTAVCIFFGIENLLAQRILYFVLVLRFKSCKGLQYLHGLLHQQLVKCGEVLEAGRTVGGSGHWGGPAARLLLHGGSRRVHATLLRRRWVALPRRGHHWRILPIIRTLFHFSLVEVNQAI